MSASYLVTLLSLCCLTALQAGPVVEWRHPTPTGETLSSLAYGDGIFVAVGSGSTILVSDDGSHWELAPTVPPVPAVSHVIHTSNGFYATAHPDMILHSEDGRHWHETYRWEGDGRIWFDNVAEANGTIVAAGILRTPSSSQPKLFVATKPPAENWRTTNLDISDFRAYVADLVVGNDTWLILVTTGTESEMFTSNTGETWEKPDPVASPQPPVNGIAFARDRFFGADGDGHLWTSTDGRDWSDQGEVFDRGLVALTASPEGLFALEAFQEGAPQRVIASDDGLAWTATKLESASRLYGLSHGNGQLFAFGLQDRMVSAAPDGLAWTRLASREAESPLQDIAFGNGRYVAVGGGGPQLPWQDSNDASRSILVSEDSESWTPIETEGTQALYGIAFGNGRFVAVGAEGIVESSPDGIHWTVSASLTSQPLFDILFDGQRFVTVGGGGSIFHSSNAEDWTDVSYGVQSLHALAWNGHQYVIGGFDSLYSSARLDVPDGHVRWHHHTLPPMSSIYAATASHGGFIVGGGVDDSFRSGSALLLTSEDGIDWEKVPATDHLRPIRGLATHGAHYVATSTVDLGGSAQSDLLVSTDGRVWQEKFISLLPLNRIARSNGRLLAVGDASSIVEIFPDLPRIPQQPTGYPLRPGDTISLSAVAEDPLNGELVYQWMRDDVPLTNDERIFGADTPNLTIQQAETDDSGIYRLVVHNENGGTSTSGSRITVANHLTVTRSSEIPQGITEFFTIQHAIDTVGDRPMTIRVEPGKYTERISFRGKSVLLTSVDPSDPAIVDSTIINPRVSPQSGFEGPPSVRFETGEDNGAILRGFRIDIGGILIDGASPVVEGNVIHNGIQVKNVDAADPVIIRNNRIEGAKNGIRISDASARIRNNFIADHDGAGIHASSTNPDHHLEIINNTIVENERGVVAEGSVSIEVANSLIAFNDQGLVRNPENPGATNVRYSMFWRNQGGNFVNTSPRIGENGNLLLEPVPGNPRSPMIDAGDPNSDFSLEPMPNGGRINIGANGNTPLATVTEVSPLVSTMIANDTFYVVRSGPLDHELPIVLGSHGTPVLAVDFTLKPNPVVIPSGETLLPVTAAALPGQLLGEEATTRLVLEEHPDYWPGREDQSPLPIPEHPYNVWLKQHLNTSDWTDASRTEPTADADGRGIPNLMRYALGLNLENPPPRRLPAIVFDKPPEASENDPVATFRFTRRADSAGIDYIVEHSEDLVAWMPLENPTLVESPAEEGLITITVFDETLTERARRFLRLRVVFTP